MFDNKQEQDDLIETITKSILSTRPQKSKRSIDKDKLMVKIPLDKVLPPAAGHGVGLGVPNTSDAQSYKGGFVEDFEGRLCKLLEEMADSEIDQTEKAQEHAQAGKVGTVGVLGHSKGDREPATASAAYRQEVDPYAKRGKAAKMAKEANKGPVEKLQDTIEKAAENEIKPA